MAIAKPTRRWTYDDLVALPDDGKRYEIIDGELYEMTSPTWDHGQAVINLIGLLLPLVRKIGGELHTAPQDVLMPGADPVQPDVFMLAHDQLHLISERGVEGAPRLVVEVLSPSTARRDRVIKRAAYARGGVEEYWLVSPEAGTIEVLVLQGGEFVRSLLAGGDDLVTSQALPELSFQASAVFASAGEK